MKNEYYQLKVACVSYLNLKQNKSFKEKVDNCLSNQLYVKTPQQISTSLKQDNTRVIDLIMFYLNMKSLIFKVLGIFVY